MAYTEQEAMNLVAIARKERATEDDIVLLLKVVTFFVKSENGINNVLFMANANVWY